MSPDNVADIPAHCANGHDWIIGDNVPMLFPLPQAFVNSFEKLRSVVAQGTMGFRILLEIAEP
jgi:hypothetical protein